MRSCFLIFSFLFFLGAGAQSLLTGRVLNRLDGKPLAGVSVYINNSGVGTQTDSLGRFRLYTIMNNYDLVVSFVGFERQSFRVDRVSASELNIVLNPRMDRMDEVQVRYRSKETWKKWGELFRELLIGRSRFAGQCTILNPEDIWFRFNKQTKTFYAHARAPIQVRNDALGYLLQFDVDSFSYSFQTNLICRMGSFYFTPLSPADSVQEREWAVNRSWAYRGSKMHFFRSVYSGKAEGEGYRVYLFRSRKNLEKWRVRGLVNAMEANLYEKDKMQGAVPASLLSNNRDSIRYYEDILKTPDQIFYDSVPLHIGERVWTRDSLVGLRFAADTFLILYRDPIETVYREGKAGNARRYKGLSKQLREQYSFFTGQVPLDRQYTVLALAQGESLLLAKNGYTYGALLFDDGYMAWKRIAHLLPWDYDPEAVEAVR